jgi:hypothetical protein
MLNWIFGRSLKSELYETKKIRICGVRFTIKKVNLLNYLDGSKVLLQKSDVHKTAASKEATPAMPIEKAQKHCKEVLVAGVAEPKLVFDKGQDGICVDDLFINDDLVNGLYNAILEFTYGKKKVKQLISAGKNLSS